MHSKKNILLIIFSFLILTIFIISGTYYYFSIKQQDLLNSIYNSTNSNILKLTKNSSENKKNTNLSIVLSLANDMQLLQNLQEENYERFNYKYISDKIKENTKFKNIWIQILDKKGNSIYRSWTDKKDDNLLFRNDLKNFSENKNVSTSISVGIFSLTLKARTPIIDENNNFLGAIEVISHFNSISNDLKENNIDTIVITEKKYKETLKFPYTKLFIDDYYIANIDANKDLINYLERNKVEKYFEIKDYIIENNYLISKYELLSEKNEKLGYILNFLELKDIDTQIVASLKVQTIMASLIALIIIFFLFLLYSQLSHIENRKFPI